MNIKQIFDRHRQAGQRTSCASLAINPASAGAGRCCQHICRVLGVGMGAGSLEAVFAGPKQGVLKAVFAGGDGLGLGVKVCNHGFRAWMG